MNLSGKMTRYQILNSHGELLSRSMKQVISLALEINRTQAKLTIIMTFFN